MWSHISGILALKRLRQEDLGFGVSPSYTLSDIWPKRILSTDFLATTIKNANPGTEEMAQWMSSLGLRV